MKRGPGMKREMTQEERCRQDAAICEAFRNGTARRKLVQEFGISRSGIYKILRAGGIAAAYTKTKITPQQRRERDAAICEAFRNGTNTLALAKEFDIDRTSIYDILGKGGIRRTATMKAERQERDKAIEKMHRFGLTVQDIAFEFSLSLTTVYSVLQSMGHPPNPPDKVHSRNAAICEAFRNGSSRHELAEQFEVSDHTILVILKAGGCR